MKKFFFFSKKQFLLLALHKISLIFLVISNKSMNKNFHPWKKKKKTSNRKIFSFFFCGEESIVGRLNVFHSIRPFSNDYRKCFPLICVFHHTKHQKMWKKRNSVCILTWKKKTQNVKGKCFLLTYLVVIESWVAFVNPSNVRFRKHSKYPRGAFGCASLPIVFELVWNQPDYGWDKHKIRNGNCQKKSFTYKNNNNNLS